MINIAFILGGAYGEGGIARVVSIVSNHLVQYDDISVSIISFCTKVESDYKYDPKIKHFGLYSDRVSMVNAIIRKKAVSRLKKILIENNIDKLFACGDIFFPLSIMAARNTSTKCICWEHSDPNGNTDHRFQKLCRFSAVKKADKILVLTKMAQKIYQENYNAKANKIIHIYNPVSENAFVSKAYSINSKKLYQLVGYHIRKILKH